MASDKRQVLDSLVVDRDCYEMTKAKNKHRQVAALPIQ
jgi:hypothetical protein